MITLEMEPTPELIRQLEREEIEAFERMTPMQRFFAGPELFEVAAQFSFAGIRHANPQFTDEQVRVEFRRRISVADRIENAL
jgi:hypothetical protein